MKKFLSFDKLPTFEGIDPCNLLEYNDRYVKLNKDHMLEATVPLNLFEPIFKSDNFVKHPTLDGIVPNKLFE